MQKVFTCPPKSSSSCLVICPGNEARRLLSPLGALTSGSSPIPGLEPASVPRPPATAQSCGMLASRDPLRCLFRRPTGPAGIGPAAALDVIGRVGGGLGNSELSSEPRRPPRHPLPPPLIRGGRIGGLGCFCPSNTLLVRCWARLTTLGGRERISESPAITGRASSRKRPLSSEPRRRCMRGFFWGSSPASGGGKVECSSPSALRSRIRAAMLGLLPISKQFTANHYTANLELALALTPLLGLAEEISRKAM